MVLYSYFMFNGGKLKIKYVYLNKDKCIKLLSNGMKDKNQKRLL